MYVYGCAHAKKESVVPVAPALVCINSMKGTFRDEIDLVIIRSSPSCSHTSTFGKNSINSMKDTFSDETDGVNQDLFDKCKVETLNLLKPVMMICRLCVRE